MEYLVPWLIGGLMATISFFAGSMLSPHAKAYKVQAQTWQGQYSGLKKQFLELQGNIDDQDPLNGLLKSIGLDPKLAKIAKPFIAGLIENYAKTGKLVVPGLGEIGGGSKGADLQRWT